MRVSARLVALALAAPLAAPLGAGLLTPKHNYDNLALPTDQALPGASERDGTPTSPILPAAVTPAALQVSGQPIPVPVPMYREHPPARLAAAGSAPKDWHVRMAQLSREIQRKKINYNYREDPPPGAKHAPFKDALLTRCSLRVFRSRTLYTRYCPKASPAEFARLSNMLRRMKDNCNNVRSAQQIESRLRVVIGHPSLSGNATCVRELMAHNDRIAHASVESLARLEALYRTEYPNQNGRNRIT